MTDYITTQDITNDYVNKISKIRPVTYEHKLDAMINALSWSEIHNNFVADFDGFIDTPMHVEKYFTELLIDVLDEYQHPSDCDIMIQWLNDNIPNWILVELGQEIKTAIDENEINREAMAVQ